MKRIFTYLEKRWEIFALLVFWVGFILVYSYHITDFPIFEDEAELLLISERVLANPAKNLFLLMRYGPLPALSWLVAAISMFTKDTLLGGRLLNVLLASTLVFWSYLITKLYKLPKRFFIFSSLLITFSPILLLNARVALWDTAVMVFSAWYIYFFLLFFKKPSAANIALLFVFLLFSFLIKFTSFFALPGLLLLSGAAFLKKSKRVPIKIFGVIALSVIVFVLLIYSNKTLVVGDAASSFITSSSPVAVISKIRHNIWLYMNWLTVYYRFYPLYLVAFGYTLFTYKLKKTPEVMGLLSVWFVVSSLMMVSFNRFFYPRHILILVLPIMITTSYFLIKIPSAVSVLIVGLIIVSRIFLFRDIVVNYFNAEIAKEDRFQYFEDYTSGVNVDEISTYIARLAKDKPTVVWLDGSWVMEYGLRRELKEVENITFKSYVAFGKQGFGQPEKVVADSGGVNYVIVNRVDPPNVKSLTQIAEFSWLGHRRQYLYRI